VEQPVGLSVFALHLLSSCVMYSLYIFTVCAPKGAARSAGDKIEKNERGGACSWDGGGERRVQGFDEET
jgi:hypothetical protein